MTKNTNRIKTILLSIVFPIVLIAIWHIAVVLEWVDSSDAAKPFAVIEKMITLFVDKNASGTGYIPTYIAYSLMRLISGVMIGCFLGVSVAFVNTIFRKIYKFFSPTLKFLAPIPIVIWIPFFIMMFGSGTEIYKIGLIAVSTFFLTYINLYASYKSINKNYLDIGFIYEKK
jgi:ABC-type nitrate/sulfonate/bicarbonate transport system permease component